MENSTKTSDSAWVAVLKLIRRVALTPRPSSSEVIKRGIDLSRKTGCSPLTVASLPEFERGVVALALELVALAWKTPEGRQALLDLGFEPTSEDVERPGSGGRDDG